MRKSQVSSLAAVTGLLALTNTTDGHPPAPFEAAEEIQDERKTVPVPVDPEPLPSPRPSPDMPPLEPEDDVTSTGPGFMVGALNAMGATGFDDASIKAALPDFPLGEPARVVPSPFDALGEPVELHPPAVSPKVQTVTDYYSGERITLEGDLAPKTMQLTPPTPRGFDFVPQWGSWWTLPNCEFELAIEVRSGLKDGNVLDAEQYSRLADGTVVRAPFAVSIEDFRAGLLLSIAGIPTWITAKDDAPKRAKPRSSAELKYGKWYAPKNDASWCVQVASWHPDDHNCLVVISHTKSPTGELTAQSVVPVDTLESEYVELSCQPEWVGRFEMDCSAYVENLLELSNEIGTEPAHISTLIEAGVSAFTRIVTLKSVADSSPVLASVVELLKSPHVTGLIRQFFGVEAAIHDCEKFFAAETMRQSASIISFVEQLKGRIVELENALNVHCEMEIPPDPQNGKVAAPAAAFELSEVLATINRELNPIREEMAQLLDRQDLVEKKRLLHDETVRKSREARHAALRKPKREKQESRRARDKTLREQKRRVETVVPVPIDGPPVKRGRGRPRKGEAPTSPPKAPQKPVEKPATGLKAPAAKKSSPPPKPTKKVPSMGPAFGESDMKAVDQFIGGAKDGQVRAALARLEPAKLKAFLAQAGKGLPDMAKLTPWTKAEQGHFAGWFFGARRAN